MYGKPADSDPEGIYRSTDCGKSWVLINQNHLYGGTGNGNYVVGDMNTFGTVYMSTVGCGIVVGKVTGSEDPKPVTTGTTAGTTATTTKTTTTTGKITTTKETPTSTLPDTTTSSADTTTSGNGTTVTQEPSDVLLGDTNLDGRVDVTDAVLLNKAVAGAVTLQAQALLNADCDANGELGSADGIALLKFLVHTIDSLPDVG